MAYSGIGGQQCTGRQDRPNRWPNAALAQHLVQREIAVGGLTDGQAISILIDIGDIVARKRQETIMGKRLPLYQRMLDLGIGLQEIASVTGRDRSTIQKQLTGVNPLKVQVRQAVETAIATIEAGQELGTEYHMYARDVDVAHLRSLPRVMTMRDRALQELAEDIRCVEITRERLIQHGVETVEELLETLNTQRDRLRSAEAQRSSSSETRVSGSDAEPMDDDEQGDLHGDGGAGLGGDDEGPSKT